MHKHLLTTKTASHHLTQMSNSTINKDDASQPGKQLGQIRRLEDIGYTVVKDKQYVYRPVPPGRTYTKALEADLRTMSAPDYQGVTYQIGLFCDGRKPCLPEDLGIEHVTHAPHTHIIAVLSADETADTLTISYMNMSNDHRKEEDGGCRHASAICLGFWKHTLGRDVAQLQRLQYPPPQAWPMYEVSDGVFQRSGSPNIQDMELKRCEVIRAGQLSGTNEYDNFKRLVEGKRGMSAMAMINNYEEMARANLHISKFWHARHIDWWDECQSLVIDFESSPGCSPEAQLP